MRAIDEINLPRRSGSNRAEIGAACRRTGKGAGVVVAARHRGRVEQDAVDPRMKLCAGGAVRPGRPGAQ
ncbi:hypothetical protein, partial [Proteus mirabilis]|uniref:hypothetical protein n=1 Tax=Proteus mirabilis TaxID=584 RepID=UPI0013D28126